MSFRFHRRWRVAACAAWLGTAGSLCSPANAADYSSLTVSVTAKEWLTDWTTWRVNNVFFGTGRIQVSEPLHSAMRLTTTPQISARYSDFFVSASYLVSRSYPLTGSLESLSASRREYDANAGYYVLPGVAVTAGYKQIRQDYGPASFQWKGPTVGLAGSAPVASTNLAVYGLFGYGRMKLAVPSDSRDAAGDTRFTADYALVEAGLGYLLHGNRVLDKLRVTLSYRAQILNTKGYKLLYLGNNNYTSPSERDFTQGPALGVSASF